MMLCYLIVVKDKQTNGSSESVHHPLRTDTNSLTKNKRGRRGKTEILIKWINLNTKLLLMFLYPIHTHTNFNLKVKLERIFRRIVYLSFRCHEYFILVMSYNQSNWDYVIFNLSFGEKKIVTTLLQYINPICYGFCAWMLLHDNFEWILSIGLMRKAFIYYFMDWYFFFLEDFKQTEQWLCTDSNCGSCNLWSSFKVNKNERSRRAWRNGIDVKRFTTRMNTWVYIFIWYVICCYYCHHHRHHCRCRICEKEI